MAESVARRRKIPGDAGAAIEDVAVALGHTGVDTCVQHYLQSFRTVVGRAADAYEGAMLAA